MFPFFKSSACGLVVFLMAGPHVAVAQPCPPNAHARTVAAPGNLRTAHCWCDDGYANVAGACVRVTNAAPRAPTPAPAAPPVR